MNIEIRKAKPEETEQIININIEVWNQIYKDLIPQDLSNKIQEKSKERIEQQKYIIQHLNNVYVALVDGKIVGFESFGKSFDEKYYNSGELYTAYILKDYQRLGLGRKMAVECMKDLLNQGYTTIITKCLEGNPSNEFHKSLGGVYVGQDDFKPKGIYVCKENIYYHNNLEKSIEYHVSKINKKIK